MWDRSLNLESYADLNLGDYMLKVGPATFGVSAQYIRHFSSKSQGRVTGKIGRSVHLFALLSDPYVVEESYFLAVAVNSKEQE